MTTEIPNRILLRPRLRRNALRLIVRRALWRLQGLVRPDARVKERIVDVGLRVKLAVIPEDMVEISMVLNGVHEYTVTNIFLSLLRPGMNVVDVGAHIGQFTLLSSKVVGEFGQVIGVEAIPATFTRLQANVGRNGCKNVSIHNVAVSDTSGTLQMYLPQDPTASLATANRARFAGEPISLSLEATTLDELCREIQIDALKIDIEGHEKAALQGAEGILQRDHPLILVELNDVDDSGASPTVELLRTHGYDIFEMFRWRLERIAPGDVVTRTRSHLPALNVIALHPAANWRPWLPVA